MSTDYHIACKECKVYLSVDYSKYQVEELSEWFGDSAIIGKLEDLQSSNLVETRWIPFMDKHSTCWEGLVVIDEYNMDEYERVD